MGPSSKPSGIEAEGRTQTTSQLRERAGKEVLDLRPGEPRFRSVCLPAVVHDAELEKPARPEQLHALEPLAGGCLVQLHEQILARGAVGRSAPEVRERDEL